VPISPHIKQKLYQLTGINYSDDQIILLKQECLNSDLDFYDYVKSKNDTEVDKLISFYNSLPDVDYFDLSNERTKNNLIKISLSKLTYLNRTTQRIQKLTEDFSVSSVKDLFFKVVPKIKNNNLFWILYGAFYSYYEATSYSQKQFLEIITEERLKINLFDRSRLVCILIIIMCFKGDDEIKERFTTFEELKKYYEGKFDSDFCTMFIKRTKKIYDSVFDGVSEDITHLGIYRGFKINKSDKENIIMDKVNNKQIAGRGMSYSYTKQVAYDFAVRKNDFYYFLTMIKATIDSDDKSDQEKQDLWVQHGFTKEFYTNKKVRDDFYNSTFGKFVLTHVRNVKKNKPDMFDEIMLNEKQFNDSDLTAYVGTYGVKKEDIIFITLLSDESEVVCNPDNVEMLSYKPVTFKEYLSSIKE
jgi:hypothetical protein